MYASPARGHLGVALQPVDVGLCPGGDLPRLRIAAAVEIDAGVGVVSSKDKPESSTTVGARVILLPLFKDYRESRYALVEGPPGCVICRISITERLRVNRDLVEFYLAGLLVDAVSTTPQHPLRAGLESSRYPVEVLSRGAGVGGMLHV